MAGSIRHTESFTMNGSDVFIRTAFDIAFRPSSFIVGGVQTALRQTFVDSNDSVSWFWTAQSPDVNIQSGIPPAMGTVISITYESTYSNLEGATTPAAITALANINAPQAPGPSPDPNPPDSSADYTPAGNSGIFTSVFDSPGTSTGAGASAIATGLNRKQSVIPVAINFKTDVPGARIGQKIAVNKPIHNLNADYIISSVSAKPSAVSRGRGSFFEYTIEAVILQAAPTQVPADTSGITQTITSIYPISPTQPFEKINTVTKLQPPPVQYKEFQVIIGNGGDLIAGIPLGNRRYILHNQTFDEVYILPDPSHPPVNQDLVVDAFLDGVSIFGTVKLVVTSGTTTPSGTLFRGYPSIFRAYRGQILTFSATYVNIIGTPTAAQNVTVQFEGRIS